MSNHYRSTDDWRGIHYTTYLLLRVLELIFWTLGAIGIVAAIVAAMQTEKLSGSLYKTSHPHLEWGISAAITTLIVTLILVIGTRLLAAFTLRRSIEGFEELFEAEDDSVD